MTFPHAFWTIALGVIAVFMFLWALGAFAVGDVVGVAVFVGALLAAWIAHALHRPG